MTNVTHSPAPWEIIRNNFYTDDPTDTKISEIKAANGVTVLYTDSGYFQPKDEDALLVAAAPDMLAEIWALLVSIDIQDSDGTPINYQALGDSARKVWKKATGKEWG